MGELIHFPHLAKNERDMGPTYICGWVRVLNLLCRVDSPGFVSLSERTRISYFAVLATFTYAAPRRVDHRPCQPTGNETGTGEAKQQVPPLRSG
jgi:hypothetical protein